MKKYFVYELFNVNGIVEYVGESINPDKRFYRHIKCKSYSHQSPSVGKFYNRIDLQMRIVDEFFNKKDAFNRQCELQKQYNLETDSIKMKRTFNDEVRAKLSEKKKLYWKNK